MAAPAARRRRVAALYADARRYLTAQKLPFYLHSKMKNIKKLSRFIIEPLRKFIFVSLALSDVRHYPPSRRVCRRIRSRMAAAASVAWFLEACGASPLRAPSATAAKAAARAHAEPPYDVPFDIVVLICMAAWQCDANAPLLAAINHKFKAASAEAATNVTTIDVMPRRANVTIPKNDSIDPEHGEDVVKFREELSRWGLRLEHYTQFRVHLPRVPSSYSQLVEKKTIANLLVDRQEKDGHAPPRLKYENIVSFSGSIDSTEAQGTLFDFSAQRFIFTHCRRDAPHAPEQTVWVGDASEGCQRLLL